MSVLTTMAGVLICLVGVAALAFIVLFLIPTIAEGLWEALVEKVSDLWARWRPRRPTPPPVSPPLPPPSAPSEIQALASHPDPWSHLVRAAAMRPRSYVCGRLNHNRLAWTQPGSHVLALGQGGSAKSTGCVIPAVLSADGGVVSTSTKGDVFRATAHARARLGTIWHLALDDTTPTLPGCKPLRWSPIPPSFFWDRAQIIGNSLAAGADLGKVDDGSFWRDQAGFGLALLLHAGALANKPIDWLLDAVAEDKRTLSEAAELLHYSSRPILGRKLDQIINLDSRPRGSVFQTMTNAISAYYSDAARATTLDVNFSVERFVEGNGPHPEFPGITSADTIYITASVEVQKLVQPLIVGLLGEIEAAVYRRKALDEAVGYHSRPATLFALDEVASIAPLPNLPKTTAQGAGQGLIVVAALQTLRQAAGRWGEEGRGFLELFQTVVVFPGIRDKETLETIAGFGGATWTERHSSSMSETFGESENHPTKTGFFGGSKSDFTEGTNYSSTRGSSASWFRHPLLEPGDVFRCAPAGASDLNPDRVIMLLPGGAMRFALCAPWFRTAPLAQLVLKSWWHVVSHCRDHDPLLNISDPGWFRYGTDGLRTAGGMELLRFAEHVLQVEQMRRSSVVIHEQRSTAVVPQR